jgi:hypothetical protein
MAMVLMALCTAYLISVVVPLTFQCKPISFAWEGWKHESQGKCIDINAVAWYASVANMLLDFAVIILPIPQLLKLNMSVRKKMQVFAMFGMGLFITLVSIVRLSSVNKFGKPDNFSCKCLPSTTSRLATDL